MSKKASPVPTPRARRRGLTHHPSHRLDTDVTVGSPYYREKFFQKLSRMPGRALFSSCRMDEPTYTGRSQPRPQTPYFFSLCDLRLFVMERIFL